MIGPRAVTAAVQRRHGTLQSTSSGEVSYNSLDELLRSKPCGDSVGDDASQRSPGSIRVFFQNVSTLPESPTGDKQELLKEWFLKEDIGIVLLAETNKYWPDIPGGRQWRDRMRSVSPSGFYAESTYNVHQVRRTRSAFQWGGCAAAVLGDTAHSTPTGGSDTSGLGRWVWIRIKGKRIRQEHTFREDSDEGVEPESEPASRDVIFVSAYRPNPQGKGNRTVWAQQRLHLLGIGREEDPREAFVHDLSASIEVWKGWGCEIVLGVDSNEDLLLEG